MFGAPLCTLSSVDCKMLTWHLYGLFTYLVVCHGTPVKEGRIVHPRMLEARAGPGGERVLRVTDDLVLSLQHSNPYSENFLVRSHIDKNRVQEDYFRAEGYDRYLFHDPEQDASVAVTDRDGLQVEGILGETLRIHPLPESERSDEGHVAHLLFEIDAPDGRQSDYVIPEQRIMEPLTNAALEARNDGLPPRIYPELFLVLDSAFVQKFEKGLEKIIFYFGVMINAVNLRYRTVSKPNVTIRLVGFELNKNHSEPYIDYSYRSSGYILGTPTLTALKNHYVRNVSDYATYDIIYLVTGLNMVERTGHAIKDVAGFAYVGGVCTDTRFGFGEDIPRIWKHVRTMAHEVAHLLGCPHDGDLAPGTLNHRYGSTQCPWSWGYIMSYIQNSVKEFQFSHCCNEMITHVVKLRSRRCVLVSNRGVTYNRETFLPGKYMNPDKQCQTFMGYMLGNAESVKDDRGKREIQNCKVLCSRKGYPGRPYQMYALDGTNCTEGKVCYNGMCNGSPYIRADSIR